MGIEIRMVAILWGRVLTGKGYTSVEIHKIQQTIHLKFCILCKLCLPHVLNRIYFSIGSNFKCYGMEQSWNVAVYQ